MIAKRIKHDRELKCIKYKIYGVSEIHLLYTNNGSNHCNKNLLNFFIPSDILIRFSFILVKQFMLGFLPTSFWPLCNPCFNIWNVENCLRKPF